MNLHLFVDRHESRSPTFSVTKREQTKVRSGLQRHHDEGRKNKQNKWRLLRRPGLIVAIAIPFLSTAAISMRLRPPVARHVERYRDFSPITPKSESARLLLDLRPPARYSLQLPSRPISNCVFVLLGRSFTTRSQH
jgi:hypothetical protein